MTNQEIYSEAPTYFHYYYGLIPSNDLQVALEEDLNTTLEILKSIPSEKLGTHSMSCFIFNLL
jgi:hypothetical protein